MRLTLSQGPHIRGKGSTQMIMWIVVIALLPAAFAGVYFFGISALIIILTSVATAIATDIIMQKITKHDIAKINGSAVITGLLFALIIPPNVPFWIPIIGVFIAISLGKYAFGPGNNIFNPALIGRAFVGVSFPAIFAAGYIYIKNTSVDALTSATPLAVAKAQGVPALASQFGSNISMYKALFFGNIGGAIGETSALAILIGGIFLLAIKLIDFRIPLAYIGTVLIGSFILGSDPLFHILAGGLMIGAFFMATDYVTIPISSKGRWIFGLGCGIFTVLFRFFSGMPEGVMYSILIMNMLAPMIDRYTANKVFGR